MQRELVERAMAGDRVAFTEFQRGSIDRLYAIARTKQQMRATLQADARLPSLKEAPHDVV